MIERTRPQRDPGGRVSPTTPAWNSLVDRLVWQYGEVRAAAILNGFDDATEADIALWRTIGRKPK